MIHRRIYPVFLEFELCLAPGAPKSKEGNELKRTIIIGITLILMFTAAAIVGCSSDSTDTSTEVIEETTEPMETETMESAPETTSIPEVVAGAYTDLTPAQAKELIDNTPGLIIIDVSPDYADGHLPGAVNYYIGDGSLENAIPTLDKNATYLVYCHTDSASIGGAQALIDAGFTKVYRLEGNYSAWVDAGYSVER